MYRYRVVIEWSEQDKAYIARVPELAGCAADGETLEEAAKNVEEVITIWMETAKENGWAIPSPRPMREAVV